MADPMDDSDLFFSSPSKTTDTPQRERPKTPSNKNALFDAEEVREAALKRELEGVRNINEVIEGVIGTLERAKGNMGVSLSSFVYICLVSRRPCEGGKHRPLTAAGGSRPCRKP